MPLVVMYALGALLQIWGVARLHALSKREARALEDAQEQAYAQQWRAGEIVAGWLVDGHLARPAHVRKAALLIGSGALCMALAGVATLLIATA